MTWINNAINRTGARTPARNTVLPLMPEIENAVARGASLSAIYDALVDDGVKVNCSKSGFNAAIRYLRERPDLWSGKASSVSDSAAADATANERSMAATALSSSHDDDLFGDTRASENASQKVWSTKS